MEKWDINDFFPRLDQACCKSTIDHHRAVETDVKFYIVFVYFSNLTINKTIIKIKNHMGRMR